MEKKIKIEIVYNDGRLKVLISDTTKKVLNSFCVLNRPTTQYYFMNYYSNRYLIKTELKEILNDYGLIFFDYTLLTEKSFISSYSCSIHEFEPIKKQLENEFKKIMNFYLLNSEVVNNGV